MVDKYCDDCGQELEVLAEPDDGRGKTLYNQHMKAHCVVVLKRELTDVQEESRTRTRQLSDLRKGIEAELRFRARLGHMDEVGWLDRLCVKELQDAIRAVPIYAGRIV